MVRGMHWLVAQATETKLVHCTRGAILDVIIDIRPDSLTYLQHSKVELTTDNHRALHMYAMFAHSYITHTDDAEICYVVSEYYTPGCERGVRWDDPAFGIEWPMEPVGMSGKDAMWPLMSERVSRHENCFTSFVLDSALIPWCMSRRGSAVGSTRCTLPGCRNRAARRSGRGCHHACKDRT